MATPSRNAGETERVRQLNKKDARKYDREMNFFDRLLFAGGREWVCSQAQGDVPEIGVGTGRTLPHYREDVRLTGIELSPTLLQIARAKAHELGHEVDHRVGDVQALDFRTIRSKPSSAPPRACCVPAAGSFSSSTCGARSCRSV